MWVVKMYANKDILDEEGYVIRQKGLWYEIGTYKDLDAVKSIIEHEIYLYNCTCNDDTPNPKFKIESRFE